MRAPGCTWRPSHRPGTSTAGSGGRRRPGRRSDGLSRTAAPPRHAGRVRRARPALSRSRRTTPSRRRRPVRCSTRVTSRRPALNRRRDAFTPRGSVTRTSASPPDTRSARLDSTLMRGVGARASAGAAGTAATRAPAHAASASARRLRGVFNDPPPCRRELLPDGGVGRATSLIEDADERETACAGLWFGALALPRGRIRVRVRR